MYSNQLREEGKTRILIVDDNEMVRRGLAELINHHGDLAVCAEAADAAETLEMLTRLEVDLAIVDISLVGTDGIELTRQIKSRWPHLPVLILTMHGEQHYVRQAFDAGADGYILKADACGNIASAVRLVIAGDRYVSPELVGKLR